MIPGLSPEAQIIRFRAPTVDLVVGPGVGTAELKLVSAFRGKDEVPISVASAWSELQLHLAEAGTQFQVLSRRAGLEEMVAEFAGMTIDNEFRAALEAVQVAGQILTHFGVDLAGHTLSWDLAGRQARWLRAIWSWISGNYHHVPPPEFHNPSVDVGERRAHVVGRCLRLAGHWVWVAAQLVGVVAPGNGNSFRLDPYEVELVGSGLEEDHQTARESLDAAAATARQNLASRGIGPLLQESWFDEEE